MGQTTFVARLGLLSVRSAALRSNHTRQEETQPAMTSAWTVNCSISTRGDAPPGLVTSWAQTAFPRRPVGMHGSVHWWPRPGPHSQCCAWTARGRYPQLPCTCPATMVHLSLSPTSPSPLPVAGNSGTPGQRWRMPCHRPADGPGL